MLKKEILKGLEKLGIKFKVGELKEKLEARLKRAEKKLAKEEAKEVEIKVEEIKVEESVEELKEAPKPVEKPKVWYYGQHKKIVRKFEDLGNGNTRVYFDDSTEVMENSSFKANVKEE